MRYLEESDGLFDRDTVPGGPVVTFIRAVPGGERADPGRTFQALRRAWNGFVNGAASLAGLALVGVYPAMTVMAHHIDASVPQADPGVRPWQSQTLGMLSTLIAREQAGAGWVADRPAWRPEARLTALPAWQSALSQTLSEYLTLRAQLAAWDGEPDRDLLIAARLLKVRDDGRMGARLLAAGEALARHDGRLGRALAASASSPEALRAQVALLAAWAARSEAELAAASADPDTLFARAEAISAFSAARARAQVARTVLAGMAEDLSAELADPELGAAHAAALAAWSRVAEVSPLFVTNAAPGALLPGNDLMTLGFLDAQAREASTRLEMELAARRVPAEPVRAADGAR